MHHPIFGHSFTVLVVRIVLSGLLFNFLNKKKASVHKYAKDVGHSFATLVATILLPGHSFAALVTLILLPGHSYAVLMALIFILLPRHSFVVLVALIPILPAWHSFVVLVALILFLRYLSNYPNNAKDANTSASGPSTVPTETSSGASSSLTTPTETNSGALTATTGDHFDVFLNYRGSGCQEIFANCLYNKLVEAGIHSFRDDRGKELDPALMPAINNSKIVIPILSVNDGSNKQCLDELAQITACKDDNTRQVVLPIFYKGESAHVQSFGDTFHMRDPMIMGKLKQALDIISCSERWEAKGDKGKLVELVVRKVLIELKKALEPIITENSVGIKSPSEKIMKFLDSRGSTLYVGIHGESGVGKTTLAKVIYNKLSKQFDDCRFIPNVTESCKCNSIEYLLNVSIFDRDGRKEHHKDLPSSLSFGNEKVLILLDDVNDNNQLKELVGERNRFAQGSRIIITTREKSILDLAKVDYKHELKAMEKDEAETLFARHAFRMDSLPDKFSDLSREVISIVRRFPLTLEILGSYLCGKSEASWKNTKEKLQESQRLRLSQESQRLQLSQWLQQLLESRPLQRLQASQLLWQLQESQELPRMEMQDILEIVYEEMDLEQKKIFLDIACFLVGSDARIASHMWNTSDFDLELEIEQLIFLSLIKIGDNHELIMHDEVRDFGRSMVREGRCKEPDNGRRLWDYEEVLKMLDEREGAENIRGLSLDKGNSMQTLNLDSSNTNVHFKNLVSLRFLSVSDTNSVGDFDNIFSKLRWLRWERCPQEVQPERFASEELAVLDLSRSVISDNWEGWNSIKSEKLKVLNLTDCELLESTFFLLKFKHLEILILRNCTSLYKLLSFGYLETLVSLDLSGCSRLSKLPDKVGNLRGLKELFLDKTGITAIPHNIWSLKNLQHFSLQSCKCLMKLCGNLNVELKSLTELVLADTDITELPDSISNLQNLGILNIRATGIIELRDAIGSLSKLRELDASWCNKLSKIDQSIDKLSSLQSLDLRYCVELQDLPELPSNLIVVGVTCKSDKLPSFSHLNHLKQLQLYNCQSLKCIPELPSTTLEIEILSCVSLKSLTPPEAVKHFEVSFKRLYIKGCPSMSKLDLSQLNLLGVLDAVDCINIRKIRGLDKLDSLESLTLQAGNLINLDKSFSSRRKWACY